MQEKLLQIKHEINLAKQRAKREKEKVLLVAVSKTRSVQEIQAAYQLGVSDFGENRVQELQKKFNYLQGINWHLIGSLQTNKVKYIINSIALLHSLDRLSLATELEKRAAEHGISVATLIQVNVSGEVTKSGLSSNEVKDFCNALGQYPHIKACGLMTIAPNEQNAENVRGVFRELRLLRDSLQHNMPSNVNLQHLSMGMSNDYQIAIEEGATIIRLGTVIFGQRNKDKEIKK